ncbi:glycosyltransferase [Paenibacillus sp. SYP-B3998]|uniref:Glycosyltransferase n=1 Tax=Paenibacillus sp. SYP-B3998 TaxID=2678564 RepID=A0A6G3ZS64_9BACL|nr:glycosyltransferase [Paenibacillus sp. SYP-B3998]NEW04431.1 glycosyltransferase [Paenibacillus sp. SYP-B3998]
MRILVLESYPLWVRTLPMGFEELGHDIQISGPISEARLKECMERFKPHFMLSMGWGPEQTVEKQEMMRRYSEAYGVPHVYWAVDEPTHTLSFTLPLILRTRPNYIFTINKLNAEFYKQQGFNAAHLDFGYNSNIHKKMKPTTHLQTNLAVVANAYPHVMQQYPYHYRNHSMRMLLVPLLAKGVRIDFWGNDWLQMAQMLQVPIPNEWNHGMISYESTAQVYNSADIVIGLQNSTTQVTQRTYEILASGGMLITSDTPAIRERFTPNRDLIVSSSQEETMELVNYYLNHPSAREAICKRGINKVGVYTYKERAKKVLWHLEKSKLI